MIDMYCLKCKQAKEVKKTMPVIFKNGRSAVKGNCPTCKTVMYKINSTKKK